MRLPKSPSAQNWELTRRRNCRGKASSAPGRHSSRWMKACKRKYPRYSEENRENEITRRGEANAEAEDGCSGEGEDGKTLRRNCVNPRRSLRTIPKGLCPPAQGCEERATLGYGSQMKTNPNGVVTKPIRLASRWICRKPVGVFPFCHVHPR